MTYLLLTLPENIWLLVRFGAGMGIAFLMLNLGTGMLFRSFLYFLALDMRKYIYWVFFLFSILFMIILSNLFWILVPVNMLISVIIFDRFYYKQKTFIKA